jgi:hypothetical protein
MNELLLCMQISASRTANPQLRGRLRHLPARPGEVPGSWACNTIHVKLHLLPERTVPLVPCLRHALCFLLWPT